MGDLTQKNIKTYVSCTWCLSNNGNILYLKQVLPGRKTWAGNDIGDNIVYDIRLFQVKETIVNCTWVQLKILKTSTAHRGDVKICYASIKN